MPLFPYFPVIAWVGMIKVMLDVTHDDDALQNRPDGEQRKRRSFSYATRPCVVLR